MISVRQASRKISVPLAMDYETFGEHKQAASRIFDFLEEFILAVVDRKKFVFVNPSAMHHVLRAEEIISSDRAISWADEARDLSAWLGNDMQRDAFGSLYKFHDFIISNGDTKLVHLQASDHFYYMATKHGADGTVHQYFSPYSSPYEAFMNVIADLEPQVKEQIQRGFPTIPGFSKTSVVSNRHSSRL